MANFDLTAQSWTLQGWRPQTWVLNKAAKGRPDVDPVPATVPGSVQQSLLEAGLLADWNVGLQSRDAEWVEHRHWDYTVAIPEGALPAGEPVVLCADGLDYAGWVLVDNAVVAEFSGMMIPHRIDLTESLGDGAAHELSLIFDTPPPEQGQFGYTSRSRHFKSRYNYSWDWCPRIVPVGVWDRCWLATGVDAALRLGRVSTTYDGTTGAVNVQVHLGAAETPVRTIRAGLYDGGTCLAETAVYAAGGGNALRLEATAVQPWHPNGAGEQPLYTVRVTAHGDGEAPRWETTRRVGFRQITWQACEGAPADAEPWICCVNGTPVFLQGANWVPPRALYADATETDYRALIDLYKAMGANVLRVWGGAILEKEIFYTLCDEAGILVWQEFPLSSSGVENIPPDAPEALESLAAIAASYIERRAHHPALFVWSGGNELTDANAKPIDAAHPCIAQFQAIVQRDDPDRRFIDTSPTGPEFFAQPENYGKGVHHDIHGPWGFHGNPRMLEHWKEYWRDDDALFRSETGMPAAMDAEAIRRYAGEEPCWPPTTAYWNHISAWWLQWEHYGPEFEALDAETGLPAYVARTQAVQAEAYAFAARTCKERFPRCGGFIIWMGHDCFPCPANNAVIDFDRRTKPAYDALRDVFLAPAGPRKEEGEA